MTTNTMTWDEAVEVLRNLRDSSQRVGSESICPKWASEFAREVAALDVALAALQAQGEPVVAGWQYRRAGSDDAWTNGTEYGNHQQNTEADPEWETRLVYAFPHARPAPQQPEARVGGEVSYAECCDTPAYCSSVRRCTAKDTPPPSAVPAGWKLVPQGWPRAAKDQRDKGWTLEYRFLERVTDLAAPRTEYSTSMEATEQVLIAALEVLAADALEAARGCRQGEQPMTTDVQLIDELREVSDWFRLRGLDENAALLDHAAHALQCAANFFAWYNRHHPSPSSHPLHPWCILGAILTSEKNDTATQHQEMTT